MTGQPAFHYPANSGPTGCVLHDPPLLQSGILSVQNGNQLIVHGAPINAQGLTSPMLYLDNYAKEPQGTFQARVLPGSHVLREVGGGSVSFVIKPDGTASYDSA